MAVPVCSRDSFQVLGFIPCCGAFQRLCCATPFFMTPATVTFDGQGKSNIVALFDRAAPMIPLEAWLDQPLFSAHITIRVLIRSVADKEAAHADRSYNEALILSRSVKLVDEDIHKQHIVAIGEYVLELMTNTINRYPDVFK